VRDTTDTMRGEGKADVATAVARAPG
jgi:hypothetical protein